MKILLDPALVLDQPLDASFAAAVEHGYDGLELGNRDDVIPANSALAWSFDDLRAAGRRARAAGTDVTSVAVIQQWSSPDEDQRAQAVTWWLDGAHAALELGCRRINTELSGDPKHPDECRAAFLRSMEDVLPTLEREGIVMSVEPHPGDFVETTAGAVDLVDQMGSPSLRYLHCLPHTYYLGGTITEQVGLARGRFDHIHVADTYRPERTIINPADLDCRIHQHFDVGVGELDWDEAAHALASAGFDGIATVQVYMWNDRAAESFRANRAAADRILVAPGGSAR